MHDFQFYSSQEDIKDNKILLKGDEFNHCCRVLRKNSGDTIRVFDGKGHFFDVIIKEIYRDHAVTEVLKKYDLKSPVLPKIHLAVGLVKNKALDLIISQTTSLGIFAFYPLETQHSVKQNFKAGKFSKKMIESAKQCGSSYIPKINEIVSISTWLEKIKNVDMKLITEQHDSVSILDILKKHNNIREIAVMIGPEGGFSDMEIQQSRGTGFIPVNISQFRLRAELAAIVAISKILY